MPAKESKVPDEIKCHEHQEGVTRVFECDAVQGCENGSNSWFPSAEDSNAVVAATNAQSFTVTFLVLVVHLAMPSQRMTKAGYIVELRALGETPPVSWTLPELKMRLHELKESLGLPLRSPKSQTQFRTLVIEMKKCRKKADLQEFTGGPMQLHMTHNETMETLQKMCLRRIYESTKPAAEDPVGFGAHSALSGDLHAPGRVLPMGEADCGRGPGGLPPDATCRMAEQHGPAAERRDQAAAPSLGSQKASGPEDKNHALGRIFSQLERERGADEHDQDTPRRGVAAEGGAASQEARDPRRDDVHGLFSRGVALDQEVSESTGHSGVFNSGSAVCNISQDDKWEPLPGSKSRQLSFQASNLLPEAFGSLVANQRLKLLFPRELPDCGRQPSIEKRVVRQEMFFV